MLPIVIEIDREDAVELRDTLEFNLNMEKQDYESREYAVLIGFINKLNTELEEHESVQ